jgi:hypothetical protein
MARCLVDLSPLKPGTAEELRSCRGAAAQPLLFVLLFP